MTSRSGRYVSLALSGGSILLLVHGCGSESTGERLRAAVLSESCLINSDCVSPLVCAFKRCHDACETSRDCPEGQRCLASDRPFHVCQLPDETDCVYHSDCPLPLVCGGDAECRDQCSGRRDCLEGQVCTQGTCADEEELVDGQLPAAEVESEDELDGLPCAYNSECPRPLVCRVGLCRAECREDVDCPHGEHCSDSVCESPTSDTPVDPNAPEHCSSAATDGDESDVDCGGACSPCMPGATCSADTDCNSGICTSDVCQVPSCLDGTRNGAESGEDCGGPNCDPCPALPACEESEDCDAGEACRLGECRPSSCANGAVDDSETSADCGGPDCAPCDHGDRCAIDGDCQSLHCAAGVCAAPTCNDGVANGHETATDCGGSECALCANGAGCQADADCASGVCSSGNCDDPSCDDGVQNSRETDVDCGGVNCDPCAAGKSCRLDNDCESSQCLADVCTNSFTLSVTAQGSGQGSVSSAPAGISCGNECDASFVDGASVTLSAQPAANSRFAGWSGDACDGTLDPVCVVDMDTEKSVTASFEGKPAATGWARNLAPGVTTLPPGGLSVDATGYSVAAGALQGSADLGTGTLSATGYDGFVAKVDAAGDLVWARLLGGTTDESAFATTTDPQGDVFVMGGLASGSASSATFGGAAMTCYYRGLMFAKLSGDTGAYLASSCLSVGAYDPVFESGRAASPLHALQSGNLLVAVPINGTHTLGGKTIGGTHDSLAVLALSGSDLSVQNAVSLFRVTKGPYGMAVDPSDGSLAITIGCTSFPFIDGATPGQRTLVAGPDVCVAKLDSTLAPIWVRGFGSNGTDGGRAVGIADNGDVIVAGLFSSSLEWGGTGHVPAQAVDAQDSFVARLAATDGTPLWVKPFGTTGNDAAELLAIDSTTGNIGIAGQMSDTFDVGAGPLPHVGLNDVFFALLDQDGNTLDSAAAGTIENDSVESLVARPAGGFLMLGQMGASDGTAFGLEGTVLDRTFLLSLD